MRVSSPAFNLALQHHRAGRWQEAEDIYRQLLASDPANTDLLLCLAHVARQTGRPEAALDWLREAIRLQPENAEAHAAQGNAFLMQKRMPEALASYQEALRLKPNDPETLTNLGAAYWSNGQPQEAVRCCEEALRINPEHGGALMNLSVALTDLERLDEALEHCRHALRLRPRDAALYNGQGNILRAQGRFDEALACFRQAVRAKPDYAVGHHNLGNALMEFRQIDEAFQCYERAIALKPDYADSHLARAVTLLLKGDFERGWPEYEWRWRLRGIKAPVFDKPRWDGSPLEGRTILLHAEQGLGDTIQFVRYAALVTARGGRVVLTCKPVLIPLLSSFAGMEEVVDQSATPPRFDVHFPLMSLAGLFRTSPQTIPAAVPYLSADGKLVKRWRKVLGAHQSFRIGIAWDADPRARSRRIPLAHFAALARLPGVQLISLQKGPGSEQVRAVAGQFSVTELSPDFDEGSGAFMDTAAVMKNLDLVVTSDTSVAHVAGALGVTVWVALPLCCDWRWLQEREDTPWYPTMRLFRQGPEKDWSVVFERIAGELQKMLAARGKSGTVQAEISPGELVDKITILEIKSERMTDAGQLRNVRAELEALRGAAIKGLPGSKELDRLTADLKAVNETLWEVEDEIRWCERQQDFGSRFVELARSVYRENDRRAALKRQINTLLRAAWAEQKTYGAYQ